MLSIPRLTRGERLEISRRRKNETQAAAAKRLRIPLGAYKQAEADAPGARSVRVPAIGRVRPHEACRLLRVRKGLTLDDLSRKIKLSKWWLCLIEQGKAPVTTLLNFWTSQ